MITRSKAPKVSSSSPSVLLSHVEPFSVKEALSVSHWKEAMQREYDALLANNTWKLVDLPPNRNSIGCKWVFLVKKNPDGSINKFKVRLVAKGFHQCQ